MRIRNITIQPVLNGFLVSVGCQTVIFGDVGLLCSELARYLSDPKATEERYQRESINANKVSPAWLPETSPPDDPTPIQAEQLYRARDIVRSMGQKTTNQNINP